MTRFVCSLFLSILLYLQIFIKKVKYSHVLCGRIVICKKQLVIGDILANSAVSI